MSNTRAGNVIVVDTSAQFIDATRICGVRYEAGTTSSVTIKEGSSSGNVLYFVDGSTDLFEEVEIRSMQGIYVTMAGTGAKAYIYLD